MKLINSSRQSGKTTEAIKIAAKTNAYLIVLNNQKAKEAVQIAKDLSLDIRFPITFEEFLESRMKGSFVRNVVIDNSDHFLYKMFSGLVIEAMTLDIPSKPDLRKIMDALNIKEESEKDNEELILAKIGRVLNSSKCKETSLNYYIDKCVSNNIVIREAFEKSPLLSKEWKDRAWKEIKNHPDYIIHPSSKKLEIYEVGGSVRDSLLGIEPSDYDYVVVNSSPEEMLSLGYEQVGKGFPVFLKDGKEYALARTERKVKGINNPHHAFEMTTAGVTLEDDLKRRDFTINAIAKLGKDTYYDPCDGIKDLMQKRLRHVTGAFVEDPLRVMRLFRFCAKLSGFTVDKETLQYAEEIISSDEFKKLPKERLRLELTKAMSYNDYFNFMYCCINYIFGPNKFANISYVDGNHYALRSIKKDYLRFAYLLVELAKSKEVAEEVMDYFNVPNKWRETVVLTLLAKDIIIGEAEEILDFLVRSKAYKNPEVLKEISQVARNCNFSFIIRCYEKTSGISVKDVSESASGSQIAKEIKELRLSIIENEINLYNS